MNWNIFKKKEPKADAIPHPKADYGGSYYGGYTPILPSIYNGETNQGDIGPIIKYFKDHYALRLRSEQLYIESEPCQMIIKKYLAWVIGPELRLKCAPQKEVLAAMGIDIGETEKFNKTVEALWKVRCKGTMSDWSGRLTYTEMQWDAYSRALIGGDILVLLRIDNGIVKREHIDGSHVINPAGITTNGKELYYNGNRVRNGVEIDARGRHVAYHVRTTGMLTTRIEAYGSKTGMRMAYMVYGIRDGNSERGTPLLMAVMQTAKKLGRYTDATLSGVEDRAKISLAVQHEVNGTGEDPFAGRKAMASIPFNPVTPPPNADIAVDANGIALARNVTATTGHQTVNLPRGASINTIGVSQEAALAEVGMFYIDIICATVNMPPDVAMGKFNGSFSSSRMSGKSWEHTFKTERAFFAGQYNSPDYALQMYVWVNENKIQAPGFVEAILKKDEMTTGAYLFCAWEGNNYPDIDPLKTANAARVMLGDRGKNLPLATAEKCAEMLDGGEYSGILEQFSDELEDAETLGIPPSEGDVKQEQSGGGGEDIGGE